MLKKLMAIMITLCLFGMMVTGCSSGGSTESTGAASIDSSTAKTSTATTNLAKLDMTKWLYNADDDVYYQLGIVYCETPADESYEQLAVFVPGAYMTATENGDGTYTCELNTSAKLNGYTATTAPVVMPINTPGYSAQSALTEYKSVTDYTSQGFVYVHAGCRGRDDGARRNAGLFHMHICAGGR